MSTPPSVFPRDVSIAGSVTPRSVGSKVRFNGGSTPLDNTITVVITYPNLQTISLGPGGFEIVASSQVAFDPVPEPNMLPNATGGAGLVELFDINDVLIASAPVNFVGIPMNLSPSIGSTAGGEPLTGCAIGTVGGVFSDFYYQVEVFVNDFGPIEYTQGDEDCVNFFSPNGDPGEEFVVEVRRAGIVIGRATFTTVIVCLAPDTKVTMADGTQKPIKSVMRGDWVVSDATNPSVVSRVSRVNATPYNKRDRCNMAIIEPNALGSNVPSEPLRLTSFHPIIYQGARRPASSFAKMKGVKYLEDCEMASVMDHQNTESLFVYDLQFDYDGQYLANNTLVQSRSPWHHIAPLPRELFFDRSLYRGNARTHDTLNHPLPYDATLL